jgi:hypothetical protein
MYDKMYLAVCIVLQLKIETGGAPAYLLADSVFGSLMHGVLHCFVLLPP